MRGRRNGVLVGSGLILAMVLNAGGCTISVLPDGGDGGSAPPTTTTIRVRIVNNANKPLDPQIYVAPAGTSVEALFTAAYKRTDFGVGRLGTMLPRTETSFTSNCGELGMFGTQGGIFGDDLNNPQGRGRQVILQEGVNVQCGDLVTFTFSVQGGTLITSYTVSLQGA